MATSLIEERIKWNGQTQNKNRNGKNKKSSDIILRLEVVKNCSCYSSNMENFESHSHIFD